MERTIRIMHQEFDVIDRTIPLPCNRVGQAR